MSDETIFIKGEAGIDTLCHKLKCSKCGKKILLELALFGTIHHGYPNVTCGECLVIHDNFRTKYPDISKQLEEWRDGTEPTRDVVGGGGPSGVEPDPT